MLNPRLTALIAIIVGAALSRLIPHPPNATSLTAVALFAGAYVSDKRLAFVVPLAALFLSDAALGFYQHMEVVYATFALIVCIGMALKKRRTPLRIGGAALISSTVFFLITNFGVWAFGDLYPRTLAGLAECYVLALPFFQHTVVGDLFYTAILFGGFVLLERRISALHEPRWRAASLSE